MIPPHVIPLNRAVFGDELVALKESFILSFAIKILLFDNSHCSPLGGCS